jgi:phospholipase/carboxylesterase
MHRRRTFLTLLGVLLVSSAMARQPRVSRLSAISKGGNRTGQPFILGGFSQGAMVAAQVAFLSDEPLRALVLLSGTVVDEALWRNNYARRAGLHVFIAHGRADPTLSFEVAERMQGEMAAAGMRVTWFPFDGKHEIPEEVVTALNEFFAHM